MEFSVRWWFTRLFLKEKFFLRLIPTAMHSLEDVEYTLSAFKELHKKLMSGKYKSKDLAKVEVDK